MAHYKVQVAQRNRKLDTLRRKWFIRVVNPQNGQIVMSGQAYFSKWNATRAAKTLVANNEGWEWETIGDIHGNS